MKPWFSRYISVFFLIYSSPGFSGWGFDPNSGFDNALRAILIAALITAVVLWFVSFVRIFRSDNIRAVKLFLFFLIITVPPVGVVYPVYLAIKNPLKKELYRVPENMAAASVELGNTSYGVLSWLLGKGSLFRK